MTRGRACWAGQASFASAIPIPNSPPRPRPAMVRKKIKSRQLPLASEPMRGLYQRDQAGCPDRTDAGNLAQQFRCLMFPALGQKLRSQVAPQALQSIQLLIEQLGSPAHPGLWNLVQPFLPIARAIDLGAGTGNAPAAIQRLQPIHDSRQIFADGLITAPQLA